MAASDVKIREPGKKTFLLGNEAIARGALEAGVDVVTCYPGTPSTEISDTLSELESDFWFAMEYSTNEKVAVDAAFGASMGGARAMAVMKYAGLNVAYDSLIAISYLGVRGGLVIVVCDDPSAFSSGGEEDSRYLAECAWIPTLLPSNPEEAKKMTKDAFEISEKAGVPVMIRPVTRVSHMSGIVEFGELPSKERPKLPWAKAEIRKDLRFAGIGSPRVMARRTQMIERAKNAREIIESMGYDKVFGDGNEVGIIACGGAYNYALEAVDILGISTSIFKVDMAFPLPEKKLADFLSKIKKAIILEEQDPHLELHVKAIANDANPGLKVYGKQNGYFPLTYEYSATVAIQGICAALEIKPPLDYKALAQKAAEAQKVAPPRPPVLCAGCPHTASIYALSRATRGKTISCLGDVGCYGMAAFPPLDMVDVIVCMGSGTGMACGLSYISADPIVALIGDSTFFHAGLPALANAVYNRANFTLMLLDNGTTGTTGLQPNAGTGICGGNKPGKRIIVEDLVKALGVEDIKTVDPFNLEETIDAIKDSVEFGGPSVIICRQPCALVLVRDAKKTGKTLIPYTVDPDKCNGCFLCTRKFGCPAISQEGKVVVIDQEVCTGCGVCAQICPTEAIAITKKEAVA